MPNYPSYLFPTCVKDPKLPQSYSLFLPSLCHTDEPPALSVTPNPASNFVYSLPPSPGAVFHPSIVPYYHFFFLYKVFQSHYWVTVLWNFWMPNVSCLALYHLSCMRDTMHLAMQSTHVCIILCMYDEAK
ncbi:hypothetical protein BU24DRAFT_272070 [Aaosphaeria arxii CBS 175.79]|uniref:Uncharacterized protein n=1 Tax=Aaosphaeria arxii CBS 175.79 TaxID=1450172 RepID=A0A6A5XGZ1_9PLEO|nr:uncharacterized protein BU24DRAFT_272070 [Aaosphaeria arxii CBS 175.79]KAF2012203.1 hypothetical protein BU24DRAFT_272070 [Aaosphaeria arxii CBS 175.79]